MAYTAAEFNPFHTGSAHKAEHNIYIWDKNMGNLVKILEGPKEPLDDLTVWPHLNFSTL